MTDNKEVRRLSVLLSLDHQFSELVTRSFVSLAPFLKFLCQESSLTSALHYHCVVFISISGVYVFGEGKGLIEGNNIHGKFKFLLVSDERHA